ncbi:hypothetical protein SDC9_99862 [bioreactor metagenome]|uniref:Uncharacterized protein n=1 Tax=bioreactor metagenome TaxID=1076179 RepID=A0A645AK35_9ZZZZ
MTHCWFAVTEPRECFMTPGIVVKSIRNPEKQNEIQTNIDKNPNELDDCKTHRSVFGAQFCKRDACKRIQTNNQRKILNVFGMISVAQHIGQRLCKNNCSCNKQCTGCKNRSECCGKNFFTVLRLLIEVKKSCLHSICQNDNEKRDVCIHFNVNRRLLR